MISSTIIIGGIITAALLIISLILVKATPMKSFAAYFPGLISFAAALIFLLLATIAGKVDIMGAGFGGVGIACAFASAITLIVTIVFDSYRQTDHA